MRPYYEHNGITIFHGDCRDVLPSITRGSADVVIADPPYNYGKEYGGHDDSMDPIAYAAWCGEWFPLVRGVCPRTVIFPGHGNLPVWWQINRPSAVGCWYKPGNGSSSIIGWEEWEPWLYWTGDKGLVGGSTVVTARAETRGLGHPCPKPVDLIVKLAKKFKSAAILDPFLGSGTAMVAAKRLGITGVGIELNERFCEIAAHRLSQEVLDFSEALA